jgi:hypothetical protein
MVTPGILFAGLASVLPARALAQNSTESDKHVGWVSSSNGRSTSDILWSCFSILLVCTYKCIHFNVPSQKESEAGWFTWTWWRKWLKKIGWMMLIVLAPEIGVAIAMDQYLLAREQCHEEIEGEIQKKRKVDESKVVDGKKDVETATAEMNVDKGGKQEITNTHTLFANMGGFNLRIYALSLPEQAHTQRNQTLPDNVSQAENTVGAVNTVATVDRSTITQEVSFPLKSWEELGKYTPKLQSSYVQNLTDQYSFFPDLISGYEDTDRKGDKRPEQGRRIYQGLCLYSVYLVDYTEHSASICRSSNHPAGACNNGFCSLCSHHVFAMVAQTFRCGEQNLCYGYCA